MSIPADGAAGARAPTEPGSRWGRSIPICGKSGLSHHTGERGLAWQVLVSVLLVVVRWLQLFLVAPSCRLCPAEQPGSDRSERICLFSNPEIISEGEAAVTS